ncbi:MAG: ATP-binding protein, partial [Pseudomonadota bacterium]
LQTAVSTYSTLLDSRQSLIASRDFRGLQALKEAIETSRADTDERLQSFGALYPNADVERIGDAVQAMSDAQAAYLRDVVAGDVISATRQQSAIAQTRERVDSAIAESASAGATDFDVIRADLGTLSNDLSFAIGLAITIMVIASMLFLAMILFSVSRPLGQLFHAIDGLDQADSEAFSQDQGPSEFRAIGRALDALAKRVRAQRSAEDQLRQSETKLRQFAECSTDVFWETGADHRYSSIQMSGAQTGVDPSASLGRTRWELAKGDPDSDPIWRRHLDDMQNRRSFRDFLYKTPMPGAEVDRWWRVNGSPMIDQEGRFLGYRGTATDVTDQVAVADQLRQSQSRDAISRLSGGVAHDFNNLLTVLQSNLELLQRRGELKAPLREMLARCIRATERGSRLTRRLLTLGQHQSLHPERTEIASFLGEFGELVCRTMPSSIQLSIETEGALPAIHADHAMLQDALLNLVINARDAMPEGGRLSILAKRAGKTSPCPDSVAFEIADTGDGMPADIKEKVFEPFFTTKGVGHGSGLGLSMVRGFVEQSGGWIALESAPGQGTKITIALPMACAEEGGRQEPSETPRALHRGSGETILLVEDDDDVRSSMESILLYLGYAVRSASNAEEALRLLGKTRTPIALVISDLVMPGDLHGDDLAAIIGERFVGLPVVLMSGYAEQGIRQDILDHDVPLLTKPVATESLQQVLHDKLNSSNVTIGDSLDAHSHS